MSLISRTTGSTLFRGLSSFWKRFFRDSAVLQSTYDATEVILGDVYLDLMESVLSSSLRNTEIFSKRDWKLLLLNDTDLSFDPSILSHGSDILVESVISIEAEELSSENDGHAMTVLDSATMDEIQRGLYPSYGTYNVGHVTNIDVRRKLWVMVVPSGETITDSIALLEKRIISNKRITSYVSLEKNSVEDLPFATLVKLNSVGNWDASTNTPTIPSAAASNEGQYYQVATAGTTPIDGVSSWDLGDWVVSKGDAWVKAPLEEPLIKFKYGDDVTDEITITAGDYLSLEGLRQALEDQITAINASMSFDFNATVYIDGVRIVIESDKKVLPWEANTAFQELFSILPFKFNIKSDVPAGREAEFKWNQTNPLQILTDGFQVAGNEYRFPIEEKIKDVKYIYNTLYKPSLVLEKQRNYRVSNGFIYFKTNPFEFGGVAYRDLGDKRQLALWMSLISIDNLSLYYNYGYRFTKIRESSEEYKAFIRGIYYYYTHGPQVSRLKSAFNILAGIPVTEDNDETVISVSINGLTVTTDKNTYELPPNAPAVVVSGQVLQAFDALTDAFRVEDYKSNPNWFDRIVIPDFLMPEASVGLRVSSVSTFIPIVGDTGYIVGDVTTDAAELITNPITGTAGDYSIPNIALFSVERDNDGDVYNFAVTPAQTTGATSLQDVITYLQESMKQMLGVAVKGAGGNIFRLATDASFDIVLAGVTYPILLTSAETAAATSLGDLTAALESKIDTALGGAGIVHTEAILNTSSIALSPHGALDMQIKNLNVSAADELGFYDFTSLKGTSLVVEDIVKLKFTSNTVGSVSKMNITGINSVSLQYFAMQPFRQGSGDYIGDDGDPSPGWDIMNDYLKFNVFRITFNASTISFQDENISIQDIVLTGRPLYTSALITPEFELFETVVGVSDDTIEDAEAYLAGLDPNETNLADIKAKKSASVYVSQPYGQLYRRDPVIEHEYITLPEVYAQYTFDSMSTDGGQIEFKSNYPSLENTDHIIEVTDIDNIKSADIALFSSVGIFNRGKILNGIDIPVLPVPSGTIGGVYPANLQGDPTYGHWVEGFLKADTSAVATHVFIIDAAMKLAGFDPFAEGIKKGDFVTLANFSDGGNNGEYSIENIFRNADYRKTGELVDILFFRNNRVDVTTNENFFDTTIPAGATASFRTGNPPNNSWLVILPNSGIVSQRIADLLAISGDNKDIFPFETDYIPATSDTETWIPPSASTYYQGLTHDGDKPNETFYGSFWKMSWDEDPSHGDEEAQAPGTIPHGYTNETLGVLGIVGNGAFLEETYSYDSTPVGPVSRTPGDLVTPYLLNNGIYADYDAANNLDGASTDMEEITFYRGIQYHFTNLPPTDKAERYGPHPTEVDLLSNNPRVWPVGDTSTYRSYNWVGYYIPRYGCLGTYETTDANKAIIGGGSPPGQPAPAGYDIGVFDSLWTLQIGHTLCCIPGSSLPSSIGRENDLYQILLPSDVPVPGVIAPADPPKQLFENLDWIYSDGSNWIRERDRGTQAEFTVFNLGRQFFESVDTGIHDDFEFTSKIGAGFLLYNTHVHNYVIGLDGTDWTRVIGASVKGAMSQGGWYDYLASQSLNGYGPTTLNNHSLVSSDTVNNLLSTVYDWSLDASVGDPVHHPFVRVHEPGGSEFTMYIQVSEESVDTHGLFLSLDSSAVVTNVFDAIKLHYYNTSSGNWGEETGVVLPGSGVIGNELTLKMVDIPAPDPHDPLSQIRKRLRMWNSSRPSRMQDPYAAESGDLDPLQDSLHTLGKVVIAIKMTYGGTFSAVTDYLEGVAVDRAVIDITEP